MRLIPIAQLFIGLMMIGASLCVARAEDWTTTDGKVYKNITVVKVDVDSVTIIDDEGGAKVPLENLPAELQKKFNYDPQKATLAINQRANDEETNREHILAKKNAVEHSYGIILQVLQDGIIVNLTSNGAIIAQREGNSRVWKTTFIRCNTDGLHEGQEWKGTVWNVGFTHLSPNDSRTLSEKLTRFSESNPDRDIQVIFCGRKFIDDSIPTCTTNDLDYMATTYILSNLLQQLKSDSSSFNDLSGNIYTWEDVVALKTTSFECKPVQTTNGAYYSPRANLNALPIELATQLTVNTNDIAAYKKDSASREQFLSRRITDIKAAMDKTRMSIEESTETLKRSQQVYNEEYQADKSLASKLGLEKTIGLIGKPDYEDTLRHQQNFEWVRLRFSRDSEHGVINTFGGM